MDNGMAIELRQVGYRLETGRELIADLSLTVARGETIMR